MTSFGQDPVLNNRPATTTPGSADKANHLTTCYGQMAGLCQSGVCYPLERPNLSSPNLNSPKNGAKNQTQWRQKAARKNRPWHDQRCCVATTSNLLARLSSLGQLFDRLPSNASMVATTSTASAIKSRCQWPSHSRPQCSQPQRSWRHPPLSCLWRPLSLLQTTVMAKPPAASAATVWQPR